jgi:hypothetical protein
MVAFVTQVWDLVQKNKPIVDYDFIPISVLPKLEGDKEGSPFYDVVGFSDPKYTAYRMTMKNKLGMNIIDFRFTITFQYGGTDTNGGQYLTAKYCNRPVADIRRLICSISLIGISNISKDRKSNTLLT